LVRISRAAEGEGNETEEMEEEEEATTTRETTNLRPTVPQSTATADADGRMDRCMDEMPPSVDCANRQRIGLHALKLKTYGVREKAAGLFFCATPPPGRLPKCRLERG